MVKISECMKTNVFSIVHTASLAEAARIFATRRIGLLPVVDEAQRLLGVFGLRDLVEMALPDFVHLLANLDFLPDFGAVETSEPSPEKLAQPVSRFMRPAVSAREDCRLLRAISLMLEKDLHDLPVVDAQGRLVGIASRVDLGVAIVSRWLEEE